MSTLNLTPIAYPVFFASHGKDYSKVMRATAYRSDTYLDFLPRWSADWISCFLNVDSPRRSEALADSASMVQQQFEREWAAQQAAEHAGKTDAQANGY